MFIVEVRIPSSKSRTGWVWKPYVWSTWERAWQFRELVRPKYKVLVSTAFGTLADVPKAPTGRGVKARQGRMTARRAA